MPSRKPKVSKPVLTQLAPSDVGTLINATREDDQVGVPVSVVERLRTYRKNQVPWMTGLVFTHADGTAVKPELATRTFRRLWDAVPQLPRSA